ncbi:MAG: hypothetical protein ACM3OH_00520 [Bacillota bacterium]|jgi:hypothetical protein
MRFSAFAFTCAIAASVAACGSDNNGPSGSVDLTAQQTAALSAALVSNGTLGSEAAAFAPFALSQLQSAGSFSGYDAVGVQVNYTVTAGGTTQSGVMSSIIGWQGLNASAQTVDKIIAASQFSTGGTFPSTVTGSFANSGTIGSYYDRSTASNYLATTGTFNITAATFDGSSKSCDSSSGGITVTCSYSTGTMTGSFGFSADRANGSGPATFDQAVTSFELPAVRVTISITE